MAENKSGTKRGLVLEGGAMRGLFSVGIMDVLLEHGIEFDGVIGVSAGAAFGCNYVSRQPGRAIRYNKRFAHDWRFCSVRSLIVTGDLFGADFAYHLMPDQLDIFDRETYNANPTTFYAVCTEVTTGQAVYQRLDHANDTAFEWIRASASMPLCSRIVDIGEHRLLDGGIADSIPLQFMEEHGYDRNLVILTQPQGYVKGRNKLMPLIRMALRKYPRLLYAMEHRHEMYNRQLEYVAEAERQGRAIVIRPPEKLPIGHICHNPEQMQRVYDIGRTTGAETLDLLKSL